MKKNHDNSLDLTLAEETILSALRYRERYGLEIIDTIDKASNGKRKIGFSSLYPTLKKLEEKGFLTSRWGDEEPEELTGARRRYYRITGTGANALSQKENFLAGLANLPALGGT